MRYLMRLNVEKGSATKSDVKGYYIGAKTGISLGVGLTSVILAFALFRALHSSGIAQDYTILENNCMQSTASAAGYSTGSTIATAFGALLLVADEARKAWHRRVGRRRRERRLRRRSGGRRWFSVVGPSCPPGCNHHR